MVVFDEILGELLMQNNCVVVPSLGGFVANTISAKVDVEKGIITPPTKALSFNKNLTNNDGLLVNALAQKNTLTFDEANSSVLSDVAKIKSKLSDGERVHFQNVGFLYLNNAGKMAFEQDRFFNLLLESYGMGSVQFVPVEEEKDVVESESIQEQTTTPQLKVEKGGARSDRSAEEKITERPQEKLTPLPQPERQTSALRKVVRYAAVAALIPVAFYSFWIPMKTDVLKSGIIYSEDFNPFSENDGAKYLEGLKQESIEVDEVNIESELEKITSNLTPNTGNVFSFPITEDDYVAVRFNENKPSEVKSNETIQNGYHLIVGCFKEEENAQGMLNKLNSMGWKAVIVDKHKGLHRVSAASSINRNEILEKRSSIENEGLSSWILKK